MDDTLGEKHVASIPAGAHIYVSTQGDWWDLISLRCYGMKRGDDHLMHKLLEANYYLRNVSKFPAGVPVIVPDQPVRTEIPLVPWKRANVISQLEF
jgi:phage tail protein X